MSENVRRYFFEDEGLPADPVSGERPRRLRYLSGGEWRDSRSGKCMSCYDPSTGAVIAQAPQCSAAEVEQAIQAAGDVLKVIEVVEYACGAPQLMKGESLMNASVGVDTVRYNESLGVFAGIAPWNFPAMIPQGWMAPLCIALGNTIVLKLASFVPQTSMRIAELWAEAGLPPGVMNVVTAGRAEAEILLGHPAIRGVSFVGSTSVGKRIYQAAAANGKRVQCLTEAKNHALVLRDAVLERAA